MADTTSTVNLLFELSRIPNVPFLPIPRIKYLKKVFAENNIEYLENEYSLIVEKPGLKDTPKLVFMTHLDHPGIALKNNKEGKFFGSAGFVTIGVERLYELLNVDPQAIKIFNPKGVFVSKGRLTGAKEGTRQEVIVKSDTAVAKNSMAQWDMKEFEDGGDKLFLYSADNDAPTAVMLEMILRSELQSDWNLVFVFNFFEEVHQVSSYHLAKNNTLSLSRKDFLVNLESKEVFINDREIEKGVVLQIGEVGCLYGYKFSDANFAEILVASVADSTKIDIKAGITKGSCDARPFSNFELTPNIVTLTIPNRFKHNTGANNEIVQEEIYKKDLLDFEILVRGIIESKPKEEQGSGLAFDYKQNGDLITDKALMKHKKVLNERLAIAFTRVIKQKKAFPEGNLGVVQDAIYKVASYLKYIFDILTLDA